MKYTDAELKNKAEDIVKKLDDHYFNNGADYYEVDEDNIYESKLDLNLNNTIDQMLEDFDEDLSDIEYEEITHRICSFLPADLESNLKLMVMEMLEDQFNAHKEQEALRRDNRDFI